MKLKSKITVLIIIILSINVSISQPDTAVFPFNGSYFKDMLKFITNHDFNQIIALDKKTVYYSSFSSYKPDFMKLCIISGITAGLYGYDQNIKDFVQRKRNTRTDAVSDFARPFGDGRITLPALSLLYVSGKFFKKEKICSTAVLGFKSFIIAGSITQIIKIAGHRHRPNTGDPYNTWDGPGIGISNLSFPSGHSSTAFAIATVMASEYKDTLIIPLLAYCTAGLTTFSRINDNAHWASDVFLGSALGYFTGKAVVGEHNKSNENKISIIPAIRDKTISIELLYFF